MRKVLVPYPAINPFHYASYDVHQPDDIHPNLLDIVVRGQGSNPSCYRAINQGKKIIDMLNPVDDIYDSYSLTECRNHLTAALRKDLD